MVSCCCCFAAAAAAALLLLVQLQRSCCTELRVERFPEGFGFGVVLGFRAKGLGFEGLVSASFFSLYFLVFSFFIPPDAVVPLHSAANPKP